MLSHKKGFTLIELLVVIAIVSLLSSVILSSLSRARAKANISATNSAVLQYRNAIELFAIDNTGYYPLTSFSTSGACLGSYYPTSYTYAKCGANTNGSDSSSYGTHLFSSQLAVALSGLTLTGGSGPPVVKTPIANAKAYIKDFPPVSLRAFKYNGNNFWLGAVYVCEALSNGISGNCIRSRIDWYLEGVNNTCITGATVDPDANPTNYNTSGVKIANNPGLGLTTRCSIKFGR